jgi:hypothetical protein
MAVNLKDVMAADANTFLNMNEFAEFHDIRGTNQKTGRAIRMIIQDDIANGSPLPYAEGVSLYRKICHVHPIELGFVPKEEMQLYLDDVAHVVTSVEDARGIIKMILEANR